MVHDAFISYARASSTQIARELKSALEGFARRWNRARSTNVFLDDASLTASPSLEDAISGSLVGSTWLIVLLSEAAASSPWVNQEVAWWLEHKSAQNLLLVHVDGIVAWEAGQGFSADSTAVPPALRSLRSEPRWVDATWFNSDASLKGEDPRFTDVILQLFCPIHQVDRGEAVALRDTRVRHAKRLARAAIAGLSGLLIAAIASSVFAVGQMRTAQEQRDVATARLLTSESQRLLGRNAGLSRLLSVQAAALSPGTASRRVLFQALQSDPQLVAEVRADQVTALAATRDASQVFLAGKDGTLQRWTPSDGRLETLGKACLNPAQLSISDDGQVIGGHCSGEGFVLRAGQLTVASGAVSLTVSPSGRSVGYVTQDGATAEFRRSFQGGPFELLGTINSVRAMAAFRDDESISLLSVQPAEVSVYNLSPWQELETTSYPASSVIYSRYLSQRGGAFYDSKDAWRVGPGNRFEGPFRIDPEREYRDFSITTLSPSGNLAAYARADGGVDVTAPNRLSTPPDVVAQLATSDMPSALTFAGERFVLAARDGVVSLWDLDAQSAALISSRQSLDYFGGQLFPSPSGAVVAIQGFDTFDLLTGAGAVVRRDSGAFLAWLDERSYFVNNGGLIERRTAEDGRAMESWPLPSEVGSARYGVWNSSNGMLLISDSQAVAHLGIETGETLVYRGSGHSIVRLTPSGESVIVREEDRYRVWDSKMAAPLSPAFDTEAEAGAWAIYGDRVPVSFPREAHGGWVPASNQGDMYMSHTTPGQIIVFSNGPDPEVARVPLQLFEDDTMGQWYAGAFTPDGTTAFMLTASPDGEASVLTKVELNLERLLDASCARVRRPLDAQEWRNIVGTEAPSQPACSGRTFDAGDLGGGAAATDEGRVAPTEQLEIGTAEASPPVPTPVDDGQEEEGFSFLTSPESGTWITIVDSLPKSQTPIADAEAVAREAADAGWFVRIVDSDVTPGLNPGYWVLAVTGSPTKEQAEAQCTTLGRAVGGDCYPRLIG